MSVICLRPSKSLTMAEAANSLDGENEENGHVMSLFLSRKDSIAYIFGDKPETPIESGAALERLQAIFRTFNVGSGKGTYNLSSWSVRRALGVERKILKIGVGRKIDSEGTRGNSRSVTFKNKVIPALAGLNFIAGASVRIGKDRKGDKTLSLMIFPCLNSLV